MTEASVLPMPVPAEAKSGRFNLAGTLLVLTVPFLLVLYAAGLPGSVGLAQYLPLHTFFETFAIAVAALIFAIGWHAYTEETAPALLALSTGFLGVALLDFGHLLSYDGMPDFVTPAGPEKAIAFWLAARLMAGVALLAAALLPWRAGASLLGYPLIGCVLLATAAVYWLVLWHPDQLPRTFIDGKGLTTEKLIAEYLLVALYAAAAVLFHRRSRRPTTLDVQRLITATVAIIVSELCFTLYLNVHDLSNVAGHVYKVIGYWYLYRAVFVTSVHRPYEALHRSQQELWREKERARVTLLSIGDGLIATDTAGRVTLMNPVAERLTGWRSADAAGRPVAEVFAIENAETGEPAEVPVRQVLKHGQLVGLANHTVLTARDGTRSHIADMATPIRDRDGTLHGVVLVFQDVTERKRIEREIESLAYYDPLTNLPNRRLLLETLGHHLRNAQRTGCWGALMFLDLDEFKRLNDARGHAAGDTLLRELADRLNANLRRGDMVSRLSGDEFVILLPDLGSDREEAGAAARRIAEQIRLTVARPFHLDRWDHSIFASIGLTIFPKADDETAEDLLKQADTAMYAAKDGGRNTIRDYDPSMLADAQSRLLLQQDLRKAVEAGEFTLFLQPQTRADGTLVAAEALVRWRHPQRGMVAPGAFIAVAEESGLILPLGDWILREACHVLRRLADAGSECSLSVNISPRQFRQQGFCAGVIAAAASAGIDPRRLTLEITEGIAIEDREGTAAKMVELSAVGISFSLDDFGTGFSSLSYLQKLPVREIKIDRSFVQGVDSNDHDAALVEMMLSIAGRLDLRTVAEGVETEAHRDFLRDRGCTVFQGYFFDRPMPVDDFVSKYVPPVQDGCGPDRQIGEGLGSSPA